MKTRLTMLAVPVVVSILLTSCNLPVASATANELPTQTITDTPPVPAGPTPTLPGPAGTGGVHWDMLNLMVVP